jgi:hypothetical protein
MNIASKKRDDKKEEKYDVKEVRRLRSNSKAVLEDFKPTEHVDYNENEDVGAFSNFPDITSKTAEGLKKRGINYLFPVQS